jgi:hypothetical protein
MWSPAIAIAWQLWNRHRLGLSISVVCLVLMIGVYPPLLRALPTVHSLVISLIPPALVFVYVANLLVFADELGSLSSGYPRRMFTLPVTTGTLVGWPMLIATVTLGSLWLVVGSLIYYPSGYRPPLLLPMLAIAVAIAWCQVVAWSPIKSYMVRIYAAILGFLVLLGVPAYLLAQNQVSHSVLTALGPLELPLLFGAALLAVRQDRRGDDWSFGVDRVVDRFWTAIERPFRPAHNFRSSSAAQLWYELRCHRLMLMGVMYFVLGSVSVMYLFVPQGKTLAFRIGMGSILAMPFLMSGSQGASLGRMRPVWSRQRGFITFLAVRPITTGEMLEAKYRIAARCAVRIWLLTLATAAVLVLVKRQAADVWGLLRSFVRLWPDSSGVAILALAIVLAPLYIWKMFTDNLVPTLTGRRWLADGSVFLSVIMLMSLIAAGLWFPLHPEYSPWLLSVLIWGAAVLVLIKFIVAFLACRVAIDRGLLEVRSVVRLCAAWAVMAALTLTLVVLARPAASLPAPFPVVLLASLAILPLARFALAPLALDWNRRR